VHGKQGESKKQSLKPMEPWRANYRASRMYLEHFGIEYGRARLSSLKSELRSKLHCNNQVFVVGLLVVFLAASSLEFPAERFLVTCARETPINKWHIPWEILINGWYIPWFILDKRTVHSLGCVGQEEESW
jgi:hypothetical protein